MRVLVAYGSKRGGTAGLAAMIGDALAAQGLTVHVQRAAEVQEVTSYDAVVVCGALYMMRWHRDARRMVHRLTADLRDRPVWLVSSGPLDGSARAGGLAPVRQVARAAARVGARDAVTFGGYLSPDAKGFPARTIAKSQAGDWRDRDQVAELALAIKKELVALHLV